MRGWAWAEDRVSLFFFFDLQGPEEHPIHAEGNGIGLKLWENYYGPWTPLLLLLALGAPVIDFLATDFPPVEGRPLARCVLRGIAVPVRLAVCCFGGAIGE